MIRGLSPAPESVLDSTLELRDGRRLAYSAAGPADGHPVVYLHGAIGSPRWWTPGLARVVASLGLRYVVVNRPGFGGSDPHPGRTVATHARDVEELADALGWERLAVVGVSAGAPYALGCAWTLGERLTATVAVSPFAPPRGPAGRARLGLRYRIPLAAFATPAVGPVLADATLRAMRLRRLTPPRSMIEDYVVCCRPWGFDPGEIAGAVDLWHARHDRLVPLSHARRLGASLPRATLRLAPGGGHFFFRRRIEEILAPIARAPAARRAGAPA